MGLIDEGTLRERFPEIAWDQPVAVTILGAEELPDDEALFWVCRYCIAMKGLRAQDARAGTAEHVFSLRAACLDHIERVHHD
jgi:hypothetical protein